MANGVAGDAFKGVGPDLEALEGRMPRGEDGERGIREAAAAVGHHLAEAGSSPCRLVAPQRPGLPHSEASKDATSTSHRCARRSSAEKDTEARGSDLERRAATGARGKVEGMVVEAR